ncbi:NAD(P)/FAD-dependent oxidoreductase [Mesorhizobium sp. M0478]
MPSFSGEPSFSGAQVFDVAIVGGGPAGLAAAMYLARFLRSVISLDAGHARAKLIPKSRNCPGFPDGISGEELLGRLRAQAQLYGASLVHGCVGHAEKREGFFVLTTTCGIVQARRVILATGIVDKAPPIERLEEAIATGIVRLCPVCDAYEARGSRIGVVGPEHLAVREALFLKGYGSQVALLANNQDDVSEAARGAALAGGVEIWDAVDDLIPRRTGFDVVMAEGAPMRNIDVVYPSMGSDVRSGLAVALGANCDAEAMSWSTDTLRLQRQDSMPLATWPRGSIKLLLRSETPPRLQLTFITTSAIAPSRRRTSGEVDLQMRTHFTGSPLAALMPGTCSTRRETTGFGFARVVPGAAAGLMDGHALANGWRKE